METRWKVGTVLYNGEGEKVVRTVVGQAREIPGPGRCRGGPDSRRRCVLASHPCQSHERTAEQYREGFVDKYVFYPSHFAFTVGLEDSSTVDSDFPTAQTGQGRVRRARMFP